MARICLVAALILSACSYSESKFATCERDYQKLGCFWEKNTNMDLIINDRDPSSPAYQGHLLDWGQFGKSIHSLACRCSAKAKAEGYTYFSIRFWAECWAGKNHNELMSVIKDPSKRTNQCANDAFKTCEDSHEGECVGRRNAEYIYQFAEKAEESLDGGWSEYSEWSECSAECGPGIQTRERTCTEPAPVGAGKDCVGETTETKSCKVKECPIDGGLSSWSKFTMCTRSCGGGFQERMRFCNNPKPQFGGKDCVGKLFETKPCGQTPCPVDGGFTEWTEFGECSKSCGDGMKTRTRSCTNPAPAHGGKPCSGATSEQQKCNLKPCPINGGWSSYGPFSSCSKTCGSGTKTRSRTCTNPKPQFGGAACKGAATNTIACKDKECPINGGWSSYGPFSSCSKTCGDGTKTRSRTCTNPKPQFGGAACKGAATNTVACKDKECPINGGWSSYGPFGSCSKSCGTGKQTRTRTCTNPKPQYGGRNCAGSGQDKRNCNTHRCAGKTAVKSFVDNLIDRYGGESNDKLASRIQGELNKQFTGEYFSTNVYNGVHGFDVHTIYGYNYITIFRKRGKNVVVGWVSKSKSINKSKRNDAVRKVTDMGDCYAKNQAKAAWDIMGRYGVMAMVVRHGSGLRSSYNSAAVTFNNYRCKRKCNFWGKHCDHNSSLVMVFGSA